MKFFKRDAERILGVKYEGEKIRKRKLKVVYNFEFAFKGLDNDAFQKNFKNKLNLKIDEEVKNTVIYLVKRLITKADRFLTNFIQIQDDV